MTKLIDFETREANPFKSKYLTNQDFQGAPRNLKLLNMEKIDDEYPEGQEHKSMLFTFVDNKGEEKLVKDRFWQLFRVVDPIDPDAGDILELSVVEAQGGNGKVYLNWRAKIFRKADETTPIKPVNKPLVKGKSAFDKNDDVIPPKEDAVEVAKDTFGGEEIGSSEVPF